MSRLCHVEITNSRAARHVVFSVPPGVVQLCGANGSGKTSTMETVIRILAGLRGMDYRKPQLTWGELRGGAKLDLGDLEAELVLTEGNQDKGGEVRAKRKDGTRVKQDDLRQLFGDLAHDPLEMARMSQKDLIGVLQKLAGEEWCDEYDALEAKYSEAYSARTYAKQELKQFGTQPDPGPEPQPVDVKGAMDELAHAQEHNAECARRAAAIERAKDSIVSADKSVQEQTERVAQLKRALDEAYKELELRQHVSEKAVTNLKELPDPDQEIDIRPLSGKIAEAATVNRARESWSAARARFDRFREAAQKVNALEKSVEELNDAREKHARKMQLPVEGLAWGNGCITIGGRPWEDECTSSLLRICTRLLLAMQPDTGLKLIFLHRGESLDQQSFNEIVQEVDAEGATLIYEKVGEPHEGGAAVITIRDGYAFGDGEKPF